MLIYLLMKIYNQPVELIIKQKVFGGKAFGNKGSGSLRQQLTHAGIGVQAVLKKDVELPKTARLFAKKLPLANTAYIRTTITDAQMNPWDVAHESAKALGSNAGFIEPDFLNEYVADSNIDVPFKKGLEKGKKNDDDSVDPDWMPKKNTIWHLGDDFSQLKKAREAVANLPGQIRIAHLDTGYNATHKALPDAARQNKLQRCFIEGEDALDAHDRYTSGIGRMPGHGTGTLALLAGNKIQLKTDTGLFNDFLGGAPFAEIICLRISPTVILMKTSAFAEALNYVTALSLTGTPIHVVSMSMGGAPSKAWTAAVNKAYDAGITLVTAAGNNYNGLPTRHVIYPARYDRVIAACGITNDYKPYFTTKIGEMQGCFGPDRHMDKALSAFTPNTPWAYGDKNAIDFSGAGTSSATPQIAAAAAIYSRKYFNELQALEPWQRVEAIRYALFKSASKNGKTKAGDSYKNNFGNGYLQAFDALQIPVNKKLAKTPEDSTPLFPILTTIIKAKPGAMLAPKIDMFNTELSQLVFAYPELNALLDNGNKPFYKISTKQWKTFATAVIEHRSTSNALKKYLMVNWQK